MACMLPAPWCLQSVMGCKWCLWICMPPRCRWRVQRGGGELERADSCSVLSPGRKGDPAWEGGAGARVGAGIRRWAGAGDFSGAPPLPTGDDGRGLMQRAGSPLPTLLHCSCLGLRETVGVDTWEAILSRPGPSLPWASVSRTETCLPILLKRQSLTGGPIPFWMESKEPLEEMALKPTPHLPPSSPQLLFTPPPASGTANPIPGLLQLWASSGVRRIDPENDRNRPTGFQEGQRGHVHGKSQKSHFWASSLGFWLPALPPPGRLPWKPNLPGDFDFAWEGWWCVRLLREQGFLRAWCWGGRGAGCLGSIPGKAADGRANEQLWLVP